MGGATADTASFLWGVKGGGAGRGCREKDKGLLLGESGMGEMVPPTVVTPSPMLLYNVDEVEAKGRRGCRACPRHSKVVNPSHQDDGSGQGAPEAGHFFPCYIWFFMVIITRLHGPDGLNVIGLWSDLSTRESYARTLDKRALARGHLSSLANDLQDFADAIPDTHGLMIRTVWQAGSTSNYPASNFTKSRFMGIILQFPPLLPLPWHRHTLPGHIPYHIGTTPSKSGLVVKLNCHMPELFRGCGPDPTNTKKKKKARSVSPVQSNVSDSDDEDIDTASIIQQSDGTELEDLTVPSQPLKASHGEGTDLSRYFWPRYALPMLSSTALSTHDAISSAGMRLGLSSLKFTLVNNGIELRKFLKG
ncbi:hypothetical protein B0H10DRAFT_1950760 [Mycena sp. CBHHK59/15]|nr:hypothetical protein B0H10DRAFT_1950760 [Mycena sp. CBHHK59/15]